LAKGQYITFLDDDAFPAEDYLENMAHVIDEEAPDCVCGPIYPYYTSPKPNWFKDDYEIRQYGKERVRFPEGQVWSGSNMTWKKTVLDTLGGFNTMLGMKGEQIVGGEDTELFERYWAQGKGKIVYAPSVRVFHWVPVYKMSVCYILKRNVAVGIAWARMHGEVSGIAKALLILRWLSEAFFIIVISPVFFFRHFNIQQWLVDAFSRVAVRWGKITGLAGIELELKSQ
jgi:GT2 family glycosyltransferase